MASNYIEGFLGSNQAGVEAVNDVTVCVRNFYQNLNPLVTRLANIPVDRVDFVIYTHPFRPASSTLGVAISSTSTATLTFANANFAPSLMNHDVLEVTDSATGNVEVMQLSGDPTSSTVVPVTRALAGTSALSSITNGSTVNLITNSRTGDEINQTALTTIGTPFTQYCQTVQSPVSVGGSAQTNRAAVLPGGIASPFSFNQTLQLQNHLNDVERAMMYGHGQAPVDNQVAASATTAMMFGIRNILTTNNTKSPVNAGAYGSSDFMRDTLNACVATGGNPNLMFVSSNFMQAFEIWGMAVQRLSAGATEFGTPINIIKAPFLDDITIVQAPLLRPFTAFACNTDEVYTRWKRQVYWNLRGNVGDRVQGEWISESAIQVENEQHHAWVEGITAFSAN